MPLAVPPTSTALPAILLRHVIAPTAAARRLPRPVYLRRPPLSAPLARLPDRVVAPLHHAEGLALVVVAVQRVRAGKELPLCVGVVHPSDPVVESEETDIVRLRGVGGGESSAHLARLHVCLEEPALKDFGVGDFDGGVDSLGAVEGAVAGDEVPAATCLVLIVARDGVLPVFDLGGD